MKSKLLLYGTTIMLLVFSFICFLIFYPMINNGMKDETSIEVNWKTKKGEETIPFLVYIPSDNKLLEPKVLNIDSKGDVYKNLVKSLLVNSNGYFTGDYSLSSVNKKDSLVKIKFSSNFKDELSLDEDKRNLEIMSMVNTFSEITGVEYVEIYSGRDKLSLKGIDRFQRNSSSVNIERFDSPENALRKQMKYEQKGDFLKSYLIMSHRHSEGRKMYFEYVKEMEEIKSLGFLSGDFKIKSSKTDKNEAVVKVEFINVSKTGENVNSSEVDVKCIKINGTWFVNWI